MRFLLDTNILSDLVRAPAGRVQRRIADVGEVHVCTSIIAAAELRFGAARKGSARLSDQVQAVLEAMDILPFEAPMDSLYANLRADLERRGQPIGANDLLIAAQTLTLGYTLVTDNEREFGIVPGLASVNWLAV